MGSGHAVNIKAHTLQDVPPSPTARGKQASHISARHGEVPKQCQRDSVVVEAQVAENFDRFKKKRQEELHKEKKCQLLERDF